jgi:hypothetical protein
MATQTFPKKLIKESIKVIEKGKFTAYDNKLQEWVISLFPDLRYPQTRLVLLTDLGRRIAMMLKAFTKMEENSKLDEVIVKSRGGANKARKSLWEWSCRWKYYPF